MRFLLMMMLCLTSLLSRAAQHEHPANAGCDQYPWDMNREWSLMITDQVPMKSAAAMDPESRFIPLDRRVQFALHPSERVRLAAVPEKTNAGITYAGMGLIRLPFGKKYRISVNQHAWINVIGPKGSVPASKFAMLEGCERLVKTVIFPLESETDYWVQISGSAQPEIALLITLDR
ncbi:MAG: hypothetical protein EXR36_07580 [Betaproteobacteria bacterium]|nr:hypothetical protein [Betaproteobacteria bacterium]